MDNAVTPASRLIVHQINIRWKLFLPVAMIVVIAFLGYAFAGLRSAESRLRGETRQSAILLSAAIERALRPALRSGNHRALDQLLRDLADITDVEAMHLLRPDGEILLAHGKITPDHHALVVDMARHAAVKSGGIDTQMGDDWTFHVVRVIPAVAMPDRDQSAVILGMDLSMIDTRDRIRQGRWTLAAITLATLLGLAAALLVTIQMLISRPLAELARTMRRVEAGDLNARADIRSGDELERIGGSFNRMVEEIANKNARLIDTERQLLKSEKLASIGLLAAGVAHEINNPVATISMSAESLYETESAPDRQRFLRVIIDESERIGAIVRNLLGFERGGYTAYEACSLTETVREAVEQLRPEAERNGIAVTVELRLSRDTIRAQADQLRQAFVNIIDNAIRAIGRDGRIDIRGGSIGGMARIDFADSGHGIPPEHLERLFDPFFTTREVGEGFGLGLAVCYDIIKRHNGDIGVKSEPGGATFTVELPLMEETNGGDDRPENPAGR